MNNSQANLAEQVVEISNTLSLLEREEDEPKAETAASNNSLGGRGYGSERGSPIHRTVN